VTNDLRYLETHEWARLEGDIVTIGISDFAVKHLTDLVYIDLPEVGDTLTKGERFGEIESVKAVSDLNSPVGGEVVEVNSELADALDRIGSDPFGAGWMVKVKVEAGTGIDDLLDAAAYLKVTEAEG